MKSPLFFFLLLYSLLIAACSMGKEMMEITFSSGGGVSGEVISHTVTTDRNIVRKSELTGEKQIIKKISIGEYKDLVTLINALQSFNPDIKDEYGNIQRSILVKQGDSEWSISWAASPTRQFSGDLVFHYFINQLIPNQLK